MQIDALRAGFRGDKDRLLIAKGFNDRRLHIRRFGA